MYPQPVRYVHMLSVSISEFQRRFPGILKEAPIEITRRGRVIAVLQAREGVPLEEVRGGMRNLKKKDTPKRDPSVTGVAQNSNPFEMCEKHDAYKHTCGCK